MWTKMLSSRLWSGITGIFAIIGVVVAALGILVAAAPQAAPIRTGIHQTLSGSTPTPTAVLPTPAPTATPVVINENLDIPGVSGIPIDVVLNTITINFAQQKMLWKFTITNNGNGSLSDLGFSTLTLEDPNTRIYQATGQAADVWNLAPRGSDVETPTFPFAPQPGVPYKLNIAISSLQFQTESFTFTQ